MERRPPARLRRRFPRPVLSDGGTNVLAQRARRVLGPLRNTLGPVVISEDPISISIEETEPVSNPNTMFNDNPLWQRVFGRPSAEKEKKEDEESTRRAFHERLYARIDEFTRQVQEQSASGEFRFPDPDDSEPEPEQDSPRYSPSYYECNSPCYSPSSPLDGDGEQCSSELAGVIDNTDDVEGADSPVPQSPERKYDFSQGYPQDLFPGVHYNPIESPVSSRELSPLPEPLTFPINCRNGNLLPKLANFRHTIEFGFDPSMGASTSTGPRTNGGPSAREEPGTSEVPSTGGEPAEWGGGHWRVADDLTNSERPSTSEKPSASELQSLPNNITKEFLQKRNKEMYDALFECCEAMEKTKLDVEQCVEQSQASGVPQTAEEIVLNEDYARKLAWQQYCLTYNYYMGHDKISFGMIMDPCPHIIPSENIQFYQGSPNPSSGFIYTSCYELEKVRIESNKNAHENEKLKIEIQKLEKEVQRLTGKVPEQPKEQTSGGWKNKNKKKNKKK
ncbi:hypothetical protein L3Y34_011965 [Caenorhabditis briggsae]|uniref:Uncharacterized protein n=1 Tax=Caenorhabditis briggsae TaxID=6238 RepID=A0AAE8ZUA7_CAEBR|nr:hypothetical protein L3Y34_011965 [Caenorhabditis briggsae]